MVKNQRCQCCRKARALYLVLVFTRIRRIRRMRTPYSVRMLPAGTPQTARCSSVVTQNQQVAADFTKGCLVNLGKEGQGQSISGAPLRMLCLSGVAWGLPGGGVWAVVHWCNTKQRSCSSFSLLFQFPILVFGCISRRFSGKHAFLKKAPFPRTPQRANWHVASQKDMPILDVADS